MTLLLFSILLWGLAALTGLLTFRRGDGSFQEGLRAAWAEMAFLAPRLTIGVLGSGFVAELLPEESVRAWLGHGTGSLGILAATLLGGVIPGGPVLVFAVSGAALQAGAGAPQAMTFVTAWLLFSINRALVWETPFLGGRYIRDRILLSLPAPLLIGHLALIVLD